MRIHSVAAPSSPAQNNNNAKQADASKGKLKAGREVVGKVVRIIHGGAIRVRESNGAEHDVYFSSIKLPRLVLRRRKFLIGSLDKETHKYARTRPEKKLLRDL